MGTGIGMCYEGKGGSEVEAGRGVGKNHTYTLHPLSLHGL